MTRLEAIDRLQRERVGAALRAVAPAFLLSRLRVPRWSKISPTEAATRSRDVFHNAMTVQALDRAIGALERDTDGGVVSE